MDLTQRTLFTNRRLLVLIIPILLEQCLGYLVGMVDGVMVSSVGEAAVSGVSLVGNISALFLNLFTALGAGGGIVTSQFIGAQNKSEAKRSTGQMITMTVGASVIMMGVCLVFNRQLLGLFFGDVEVDVMEASVTYFFYNAMSFPFLALYSSCAAILRANGNSKVSLYVSLLRNVVNIVGNAICIYGLKMGVVGVAIPTGISRMVGAVTMLIVVMGKGQEYKPKIKDILHIDTKLMGKMLRVGLPTAIESSMFQMGRVVTLSMISGFGTFQIAANSTAGTLCNIVVTTISAIRTASLTVIGQCVGARDEKQIQQNYKKLMLWSYVLHGTVAVLFIVFRYQLIGMYDKLSPETVELTARLMCIHLGCAIVLYPLAFYASSPLRAANDSVFTLWVSIASMVIFRLSLSQLLCVELQWGAEGVWWAMIVDWICRAICFTTRWRTGGWKKKCGLAEVKTE